MSGPGRIHIFERNSAMARARLSNFEIARTALKPEHMRWLDEVAVPLLERGGSLRVIGLASRSGGTHLNISLSRGRADAVISYLRGRVRANFAISRNEAQGEDGARLLGVPDGTEDERWRSVILSVWDRPQPPPPPPPAPPAPVTMVERTVLAKFIVRERSSSAVADPGDRSAQFAFNMGRGVAQAAGASQAIVETRRSRAPDNHVLREIRIDRREETTRAAGGLLGSTTMIYCDVTYSWGPASGPHVRLIDAFRSRTPGSPQMIDRTAAAEWLDRPATAFRRTFPDAFM